VRGLMRRVVAKKDADCRRKEKAPSDGNQRYRRGPVKDNRNGPGQSNPHRDPRNATAQTEENSFREELEKNVNAPGTDRHSKANFARSFSDRNEQNVHDANAADQERYRGHDGKQKRHDTATALSRLDILTEIANVEILHVTRLDAMAARERIGDLLDGSLDLIRANGLHVEHICKACQSRLQIIGIGWWQIGPVDIHLLLGGSRHTEHLALGGRERRHNDVVLVLAKGRLALGRKHPNHAK
jgi:hypothetical protein